MELTYVITLLLALALAGTLGMVATGAQQLQIATLWAGDATTLGAATAMNLHLAQAAFVPGPNLTVASFTEATFVGYAAIALGTGAQLTFTDPITGMVTIELKPPAGGLHFNCSGSTSLPQTIFGYYVTNTGNTTLYGSALFGTPITLTASGQALDVPPLTFKFVPTSPQ